LTSVSYQSFTNFTSITYAGLSLVGGVGHILGAFVGAMMATAGFNQEVMESTWSGVGEYVQLISGISILLVVLYNPDGVAAEWARAHRVFKRTKKFGESYFIKLAEVSETVDGSNDEKVPPKRLEVDGLTVQYGTVTAVNQVGFSIEPGQVVGLIGPNGAGKTSLIDALTGFTSTAAGTVRVGDADITKGNANTRVQAGMARSFQSLELFEDTTVFENLSVAADPQNLSAYVRDLVWPVIPKFGPEVVRAIQEFKLDEDLHREVSDLSYGKRRLLAIARSVAMHPSVLLLDEPAAGLSSVESAELARVVRRLADDWGMAILLVEHDMNFVMGVCDRVVVIDFGNKIADGTPEEIRNDPAVIAAYLGQQSDDDLGIERQPVGGGS
jgi:sulfate-transporting ATPase